jgi:ribosomal protein S21
MTHLAVVMELFRIGESFSRARYVLSSCSSSTSQRTRSFRRPIDPSRVCWSCRRISNQTPRLQQAAVRVQTPEATGEQPSVSTPSGPERTSTQLQKEDRALLDEALELKHPPGVAAKHRQRFHSSHAQQAHRTPSTFVPQMQPGVHLKPPPGDSYTDALNFLADYRKKSNTPGSPSIYDQMKAPPGLSETPTATKAPLRPPPQHEVGKLNLSSRTGKSLDVIPNEASDLALKLKRLNMQVVRNRVPQDFQKQRFHERPGLRRKRLKSQRWRARFKKGFSRMVTRVGEMRRMGW